jgi:hypothetical protein
MQKYKQIDVINLEFMTLKYVRLFVKRVLAECTLQTVKSFWILVEGIWHTFTEKWWEEKKPTWTK